MNRALAAALLLAAGCSPDDASPGAKKFREELRERLDTTRSLRLMRATPIPDGGSWVFDCATDSDFTFTLQALHQDADGGGTPGRQTFLLFKVNSKTEFTLRAESALEFRLIQLLEACTFGGGDPDLGRPATPAVRDWILRRMKNRSTPWTPCPG